MVKCNPGETNDKFITYWSFLSSDIIPTSSKEKESDELLYTVWTARYGRLERGRSVIEN